MAMIWADAHTDVLSVAWEGHLSAARAHPVSMRGAGCTLQVMAAFGGDSGSPVQREERMRAQVALFGRWRAQGLASGALLALEDASCYPGAECGLPDAYARGVRMASLTWNGDNAFGGGCMGDGRGLTAAGLRAVRQMGRLGMALDLSHACPATFARALEAALGPILVSHAGVEAVYAHPRNLTKWQVRSIIVAGGFIGVPRVSTLIVPYGGDGAAQWARHVEAICRWGGERAVGLGSDLDGSDALPGGIEGPNSIGKLESALADIGFSPGRRQAVLAGNLLAFIERVHLM
nr:membrane dipeptidase [bacterium]